MDNAVAFNTFTVLYKHHFCVILKHFHHPKRKPYTQSYYSPLEGNYLSTKSLISVIHLTNIYVYCVRDMCQAHFFSLVIFLFSLNVLYVVIGRFQPAGSG